MARRRILFIHQNRAIPGVELLRYTPKPPGKPSEMEAARDFETKVVRG
jgi:hypothetical protein